MVNFKKFLTISWYADITYYGKKQYRVKLIILENF